MLNMNLLLFLLLRALLYPPIQVYYFISVDLSKSWFSFGLCGGAHTRHRRRCRDVPSIQLARMLNEWQPSKEYSKM